MDAAFDLNLLRVFATLDRTRSVSLAARALGLSQPATSAALARLRRATGDPLFVYAGGAMQPTPAARRLAPIVAGTLADLRQAFEAARPFDPATAGEVFRIGVTDYATAVIVPALARDLARTAPGIDLRLATYDKTEVGAALDTAALDLAIGVFADPPAGAVARALMTETFVGVARLDHPVHANPPDAAGFAALPHALLTHAADAHGAVDAALADLGLSRRIALTLPHLMALPPILRATDMVATVPARAGDMFGAGIASFDVPVPGLAPFTVTMLWTPAARSDRAHAWLRGRIVQVCALL
jgi:DNA-binding transcriptional LysR family regulator